MNINSEIEFRHARASDTPQVVATHLDSFRGFFLSSLGPRFLKQFYGALTSLDTGILLVAVRGSEVVGFVGGSTEQTGFYRELLQERKIRFAAAAALAAVRHPRAVPRLVRARDRADSGEGFTYPACLMTLGVSPDQAGSGIGRQLVRQFEREMAMFDAAGYGLTTDADNNERTNNFYRSLGFTLARVITTREGRRLNAYEKALEFTR